MKFPVALAPTLALTLTAFAVAGCGSDGNPNGAAYANEDGGAIAVKAQTVGTVAYDPYAKPASFKDMDVGAPAISPTSTPPMPLTPSPTRRPH